MVLFENKNIIKGYFPNGEAQFEEPKGRYTNYTTFEACLIFESNEDLFNLAILKHWFDENKDPDMKIILRMAFCPYGQMDRQINDFMFSFKYVAKFINSLNFSRVIIYDPHSRVIAAAIDRCDIYYPMNGVDSNEYDLFFYPDASAASKYSEIHDMPYRFGNKKRNLDTGEIIRYEVVADKADIEGKRILIRDDICMGGRTFKEAAKVLRELGAAKVDLFITHLMPQAEEFYKNHKEFGIDNFYSANTLQLPWYQQ